MPKKRTSKAAGSVEANLEIKILAPQKRVWDALVNEAAQWWPKGFFSSEKAKKFVIEPRLGGRVFEDNGGGEGFVWYTVVGVDSPNSLQLAGFMGPPFGGPLSSLLRLQLTELGADQTKLEITDACFGQVGDCDTESGWREVFDDNFRVYVESSKKKKRK
jgi:uncharacterized protein YndB with AHSA1/START domain